MEMKIKITYLQSCTNEISSVKKSFSILYSHFIAGCNVAMPQGMNELIFIIENFVGFKHDTQMFLTFNHQ